MKEARAFVVLPPGHGKSHLHQLYPYLYEADTLVNCKATDALKTLRKDAKMSGEWEIYDKEWVAELEKVMPVGPVVIMVPSHSVGLLLKAEFIFAGVLALDQWARNLENRKGSIEEYAWCRDQVKAIGAQTYESNADLQAEIMDAVEFWHDSVLILCH